MFELAMLNGVRSQVTTGEVARFCASGVMLNGVCSQVTTGLGRRFYLLFVPR
jgi:hypothetical protein